MSTWQRMLVIVGITVGACVDVSSRDEAARADAGDRIASHSSSRQGPSGTTSLGTQRDAGIVDAAMQRGVRAEAEPDAEADSDLDAGFSELAALILRDCIETLRCDERPPNGIGACVTTVTRALAAAGPEARKRFLAIVMRCSTRRECDYVSCAILP